MRSAPAVPAGGGSGGVMDRSERSVMNNNLYGLLENALATGRDVTTKELLQVGACGGIAGTKTWRRVAMATVLPQCLPKAADIGSPITG